MSGNYPSDYPRSREEAIAALRTVRDEDIDFSEIPETTDFSDWKPVGEKFKEAAQRNLAVLNEKMRAIWWNVAPTIVRTFIESHPLKGKTVIPFATSGSSGIENSVAQLKKDYPEIQWRDGRLLNGATEQTIREWVEKELKK